MSEQSITCQQCGSTQISAGNRGYNLMTGFIGSGNTIITCLKCGNKWKPGEIQATAAQQIEFLKVCLPITLSIIIFLLFSGKFDLFWATIFGFGIGMPATGLILILIMLVKLFFH